MFEWLRQVDHTMEEVQQAFLDMLGDGRHVFDLAMSARVGGADPATIAANLHRTEERTDEAERRIRRLVLVHASVHGSTDIPTCLMYMSISKDAERISDLSKNLFGIAETVGPVPPGPLRDDLVGMQDNISTMITEAARIFAADDPEDAQRFIERARALQEHCHERIDLFLTGGPDLPQPAASSLTYRHLGRVVANLLNIVSAVVVPLDQLDYPAPAAGDDTG